MQQRMDAHVGAFREIGLVLVPELGRLVLEVPAAVLAARAEHALLGAGRLLVAADAGDQAVEACSRRAAFRPSVLRAAERAAGGRVGSICLHRRAVLDDEIELPFLRVAVAERVDLREFLAGIDVHHRERDVAEERLARQPQHDVAVLAERPQDRELVDLVERLAQDVDALASSSSRWSFQKFHRIK